MFVASETQLNLAFLKVWPTQLIFKFSQKLLFENEGVGWRQSHPGPGDSQDSATCSPLFEDFFLFV